MGKSTEKYAQIDLATISVWYKDVAMQYLEISCGNKINNNKWMSSSNRSDEGVATGDCRIADY